MGMARTRRGMTGSSSRSKGKPMAETPSHFFKVILQQTLADKKLGIPFKFVKLFGDELSGSATIRVPQGHPWRVKMRRDGRRIWFEDGWHDFVKYYWIGVGFFLVFKYQGNSKFDVLILDHSTCEIDYASYNGEDMKRDVKNPVKTEPEDSIEIIGRSGPKQQPLRSRKHKGVGGRPPKRAYTKKCKIEELDEINKSNEEEEDEHSTEETDEHELSAVLENMGIYISKVLAPEGRERAMRAAKKFLPKNPAFMVLLQSYAVTKSFLIVPASFSKKYLSKDMKSVKLQISDGKGWRVGLRRSGSAFVLGRGWTSVVSDLNLQEGYICIFELVRAGEVVLKVSVLPLNSN